MTLVLERWSERTGKDRYVALAYDRAKPVGTAAPEQICGWYAEYKEGLFAFWLNEERHFVRWQDRTIQLTSEMEIVWEVRFRGRRFEIRENGQTRLEVWYHTLFRNLADVFDDWWGLVDDLPSFIHSGHSTGTLTKQLADWSARSDAQQGAPGDGPRAARSART